MKWELRECKSADMIRVKIGSIYHYGIFISDDRVIQFGLPPIKENEEKENRYNVCVTDIDEFSCGKMVECANYSFAEKIKKFNDKKIIDNAEKRIGETGYDIIHNNCEHFVNECVFGIKKSSQIEDIRKRWNTSE